MSEVVPLNSAGVSIKSTPTSPLKLAAAYPSRAAAAIDVRRSCVLCGVPGPMSYKSFVKAASRKMNNHDYSPLCWFLLMTFADQTGSGEVSPGEWKAFCAEIDRINSTKYGAIFYSEHFAKVFAKHVGVDENGYVTRASIGKFVDSYLEKIDLRIHNEFVEHVQKSSDFRSADEKESEEDLGEEMSPSEYIHDVPDVFLRGQL